jgi:hypothetical protein
MIWTTHRYLNIGLAGDKDFANDIIGRFGQRYLCNHGDFDQTPVPTDISERIAKSARICEKASARIVNFVGALRGNGLKILGSGVRLC